MVCITDAEMSEVLPSGKCLENRIYVVTECKKSGAGCI